MRPHFRSTDTILPERLGTAEIGERGLALIRSDWQQRQSIRGGDE
jgi:hypothetical protein